MTDDFEKIQKVQHIRWFNLSFKPAVLKMQASGKISKYIAEKLLEGAAHLERERIPSAPREFTPKALNVETASTGLAHDEHLLLQGHERGLQQPEERQEGSSLLPNPELRRPASQDSVSAPVQAPERCEAAPVASRAKLCKHIWSCSCSNGPGLR